MMKKKMATIVSLIFVIGLVLMAFTACGKADTLTVQFYDGEKIVKTVEVEKGGLVENFVPNPKGEFVFDKWYVSPNLKVLYDFTKPINEATKIFGSFRSNVVDERTWEVAGAGAVEPLKSNNWGKGNAGNLAACALSKTDGANEFVITLTLYPDDLFQFAVIDHVNNHAWGAQHGTQALKNPGDNFEGSESLGDADANITVKKAGIYKFTLSTDAKNAKLDKVTYAKVGEAPSLVPVITPIVSGNMNSTCTYASEAAAKGSGFYLAQEGATKIYKGLVNFNKDDFFCVLPFNNWSKKCTAGNLTADSNNVVKPQTDGAKAADIKITAAGEFEILLNMTDEKAPTLKVTKKREFQYDVNKHNIVKVQTMAGALDYTYYVTKGGKMVMIAPAAATEGKAFTAWYNGDNPFSFNTKFDVSGLTLDLKPREITATELDPRSYVLFGAGITNEPSWKNGSALTQDAAHTYTKDITFAADGGQLTLKEKIGAMETGFSIKRTNVTAITTDETMIKATPGNIVFTKAGTFTLSFNSFTQVLTITKKV